MTLPRSRWNLEVVLILLDRGKFVVVHPCSTLSLCCYVAPPQDAEVAIVVKFGVHFSPATE